MKIQLIRVMIIKSNGATDYVDMKAEDAARDSAIVLTLSEKIDLGDGVMLKGFEIRPVLESKISFHFGEQL